MKWLKKIWSDSVWSKIIAGLLSPYAFAALAAIKGYFNDLGYKKQLLEYLNISVPLWFLPLLVCLTIILVVLYNSYKAKKNIENSVIRHSGPYITFKGKPYNQCYCAVCWDKNHTKVQLPHFAYDDFKCPICGNLGCYDEDCRDGLEQSIYDY